MSRILRATLLGLAAIALGACRLDGELPDAGLDQELQAAIEGRAGGMDALVLPQSDDLDAIPQDPLNPLTFAKVSLGRLLFHETALGTAGLREEGRGTYSCASCHTAGAGFQANRMQGIGEGGVGFGRSGEGRARSAVYTDGELDVQPVRSPSVLNAAYQKNLLWNGQFGATAANLGTEGSWTSGTPKATNALGYEGMETQAIAGLSVHRMELTAVALDTFGYRARFDEAFPELAGEQRYSLEAAGLAIAAYERTVLANEAPFQDYLRGSAAALSDAEKRGALVFFGAGNCYGCHAGPTLATMSFHALGMGDLHDNPERVFQSTSAMSAQRGRGGFTGRPQDMYAFKTPQLYNLTDSRFYGHGATFRSVREVVEYKRRALPQNERVAADQLSPSFRPLTLTAAEVDDLVTFLEVSLRDPDLGRYEPSTVLSGSCMPNGDLLSQRDRGCL